MNLVTIAVIILVAAVVSFVFSWSLLRVSRRADERAERLWMQGCLSCAGTGKHPNLILMTDPPRSAKCPRCRGTGEAA